MKNKILIINDDQDIRQLNQIILEAAGYDTIEASNGKNGIQMAIEKKPDLILLDIVMPEMDGFETCRQLKIEPLTSDIPVIFFSSLTSPKDKIEGLKCGGVDFINRIIDRGELLARVNIHLEIKNLTQSLKKTNEELVQKQKSLNDDLHTASIIQKSFLPPLNLNLQNLIMSYIWMPLNTIGGDFFNAVQYENEKAVFYIADVSGHDVPSALVTIAISQFLNQINTITNPLLSPKEVLKLLDLEFPIERFDRYFTIFYLILDQSSGNLIYSSAGHPPAIILKKNQIFKVLDKGGIMIGLNLKTRDDNTPLTHDVNHKHLQVFDEGFETLEDGDKIFLYTDGVVEVRNQDGECYGQNRLFNLLESIKHKSVKNIIDEVHGSFMSFANQVAYQDDISLIGFEFKKKVDYEF